MNSQSTSHSRRLFEAATLVMVFFIVSRALGLAREVVISHQFGTSRELEAYVAAFRIPDLIFNLVAGGALGSAFIPPFSALLAHGEVKRGWRLASHVINLVFVASAIFAVIGMLFARQIAAATVAVGFSPEEQELTANLMRLMLIQPVIFGISAIMMGVLNSYHHFLLPAVAPTLYNAGIIAGALILAPNPAFGVYGLAIGVVAGALMHLLIQIPWLVRAGMVYTPSLGLGDEGVRTVIRLMLPRTIGIAAVQINFLVNTILASTLAEGRLAALNYAWILMLLPEGIIAQSIATVLFPTLSQLAARQEHESLRHAFTTAFRIVLFLTIPASIGLILLGGPLVRILLQRGAFTAESTAQTAFALQFFALGLFAQSGLEIITRTFFSMHDTATPVKFSILSVLLNIILSLLLIGPLAQGGLALANSLATTLEMLALLYLLRLPLGGLDGKTILASIGKVLVASAFMGAAIFLLVSLAPGASGLVLAVGGIAVGGIVFLAVAFLLRSDEIALAWRLARSRS